MDQSADGQRDFDAFVMSAKGETSTKSFQDWAGGEQVTLAIVFTDVVGSTAELLVNAVVISRPHRDTCGEVV